MTVENPTLSDLDLYSASRITHHRYVRHDDETPDGWTDDGPCPGHHSRWSRSAMQSDHEAVNSPAHYKQGAVEVIDIIEQIVAGYEDPRIAYLVGSAIKYLARSPHKGNQQQDLQKAEWFLRRAINKSVATPARDSPRGRFTDDPGP